MCFFKFKDIIFERDILPLNMIVPLN